MNTKIIYFALCSAVCINFNGIPLQATCTIQSNSVLIGNSYVYIMWIDILKQLSL